MLLHRSILATNSTLLSAVERIEKTLLIKKINETVKIVLRKSDEKRYVLFCL